MIRNIVNGFCMALADSVPGVSGGTVAFIMGFYENFILPICYSKKIKYRQTIFIRRNAS